MQQKRKKPAPRRTSKPRSKPSSSHGLGIYIVIAIVIFILIHWLSKPAASSGLKELTKKVTESVEKKHVTNPEQLPEEKEEKPPKEIISDFIKPEGEVERAILSAIAKLQIDEKGIKRKKKDDIINYSIPIDPGISDLTFANIIIKGEVERLKGTFESGIEEKHHQKITLFDSQINKRYVVDLFYQKNVEEEKANTKVMAIIIDDFGNINGDLLEGFAKTDKAVCFAIMPDTPRAVKTMNLATATGHESIIHVPMEPINYPRENPGDEAIFLQLSPGEISRRMERFIKKLPDCIGANNHMGSLATADETTMDIVMQTLRKNNLCFIDSRTTNSTVAYRVAQKNQVTAFKRDVFLDEPDLSAANLNKKITECNNLALSKPYVVTIMHCHTANHLNYLNRFIAMAKNNGFKIVPVSKLRAYKLPEIL